MGIAQDGLTAPMVWALIWAVIATVAVVATLIIKRNG
jgi:hypothetical protein